MMIKKQDGFTLVELMITMIIFLLAMTAASQMFVGLVTQFKQQSKVAETNIEGVVGLELLRFDIEQAGFGLPWSMNGLTYVEAVNDVNTTWDDAAALNDNPFPPRPFVVAAASGLNNSDVLVIKATNVATNTTAQKWTYSSNNGAANILKTWGSAPEDLLNTDHVTVMWPYSAGQQRVLVNAGGNYIRAVGSNSSVLTLADVAADANYQPLVNSYDSTLIYGIAPTAAANNFISMPFNRADYYIRRPAAGLPARCAPNTGVLYKGTLNHADGLHTELPVLDCVYDMQVVVWADTATPPTGTANAQWLNGAGIPVAGANSAATIRDQVKEIRVYIVAQEGQQDASYTYTNPNPVAGCMGTNMVCIVDAGNNALVKAVTVPSVNYRWKLYTLVSTPYNLK